MDSGGNWGKEVAAASYMTGISWRLAVLSRTSIILRLMDKDLSEAGGPTNGRASPAQQIQAILPATSEGSRQGQRHEGAAHTQQGPALGLLLCCHRLKV